MADSQPRQSGKTPLRLTVNGLAREAVVWPMERLLDVLRTDFGLTGVKEGCGEGECGACSILLDGLLVNSCLVPAVQAEGCRVVTIEGLAENGRLHPAQQAFIDHGGAQCGICTPGMILATVALLDRDPAPSQEAIAEALSGNLCRCTGYVRIFDSVRHAARQPMGGDA